MREALRLGTVTRKQEVSAINTQSFRSIKDLSSTHFIFRKSEQTGILDHFGHSYIYSLDVLNTILKEEILEWTVTETASVQDKHFTYTLSDSEQKMICLISTAKGLEMAAFFRLPSCHLLPISVQFTL